MTPEEVVRAYLAERREEDRYNHTHLPPGTWYAAASGPCVAGLAEWCPRCDTIIHLYDQLVLWALPDGRQAIVHQTCPAV